MAALEDEVDPSGYATGAPPSPYVERAPSALDEEDADYGGGADDVALSPASRAAVLSRVQGMRPPAGSNREMLQRMVVERLSRQQAAAPGFGTANDPAALADMVAPDAPELVYAGPTVEKPKEDGGIMQIAGRGIMRAGEDLKQGKDIAEGKKPRDSATPLADYEHPLDLPDFADPALTAKKLWYSLFKSYPAIGMSLLGTGAGAGIGAAVSAPTGPGVIGGTAIGGILGGAAGMGTGAMLQELGPAYHAELQTLKGDNPDREITAEEDAKAWNSAVTRAGISGGLSGTLSMALFGFGKPAGDALKGILKPVVEGAAKPAAGLPLRAGVQAVGQTGISVGGEVGINAIEGRPLDTNLSQAVAGGLANVVPDIAAAAGGRAIRGMVGRRQGEVTPGVGDDQAAALAATQPPSTPGPGPGPIPPPTTPTPPGLPPVRDNVPPFPDNLAPMRDNLPPPQDNLPPPRDNLPPLPTQPPAGVPGLYQLPDTTGLETNLSRPPVPPPMTETSAPPPRDNLPPPVAPPVAGETIVPDVAAAMTNLQPTRRPPPEPMPPVPPPEPPPPPPPPPSISRIQRAAGMEEPLIAEAAPAPPGPRSRIQERYGTPEGWTTEPDHTGPGFVVKNADGNVISVGDTAAQAVEFARARAPENVAPVEKTPPAAEAKPAAVGRDTVPETPPTETTKPPTKAQQRQAEAQAKLAEVKEKAAAKAKPEPYVLQTGDKTEARLAGYTAGLENRPDSVPAQFGAIPDDWRAGHKAGSVAREIQQKKAAADRAPRREMTEAERLTERIDEIEENVDRTDAEVIELESLRRQRDKAEASETGRTKGGAYVSPGKTAENMTATELRGALRELGLGPSYTRAMKVAELRQLYRDELSGSGERAKSGAYVSPGEAAEPQPPHPAARTQSDLQREVAAEGARARRQGLVSEATRRMAEAPTPTDPFDVPTNLNTERRAEAFVRNIVAGQSIDEAVSRFGTKEPGTVGRPRNVSKLSDAIRKELAKIASPESIAAARKQAEDAAVAKLKKLGPEKVPSEVSPARRAILDELNRHHRELDEVRAQRPRLEKALDIVERIERGETIKGVGSRLREMGRDVRQKAAVYFSGRPEVNAPITRQLEQAGEQGSRLHDLLDALSSNTIANRLTPQLTELAQVLRRVLPNIEVHDAAGRLDPGVGGVYEPGSRRIYIDLDSPSPTVTLLHEAIHNPTFDYVNHLYMTPEISLTPRELAHKSALGSIEAEIQRVIDKGGLSPLEDTELRYALNRDVDPSLNMAGPHELATQLLSTPELYNVLSRERASPEFRAALDRVGMGVSSRASIWDGFKRIVRHIFGVPDKLDSVFDYVLRPLTEIVETGARFRSPREAAEIRGVHRHNAEMLGPAKLRDAASLRWMRDASVNFADPKGRLAMRGAFQAMGLHAIHDMIEPYVPAVTAHRRALDRVKRTSEEEAVREVITHDNNGKAIAEPMMDKANRLSNELRESPEQRQITKLMSDVQYAGMSVIDDRRNTHLKTQEEFNTLAKLRDDFNQLSPASQQIYREHNELKNEWHRARQEAAVEQFVDAGFPDLSDAERAAIRQQMRTRQGVLDVLDRPDSVAIVQQLGENRKALLQHIADSQRIGFVDGDYFGLRRNGEYVLSYGDPKNPASYGVEHFERATEAQVRKDQLETGTDTEPARSDVSQVFVKSKMAPNKLFQNPEQALGTFDRAMEKGGVVGEKAKILRDLYATQLIQQGTRAATHTMRREGIRGASEDYARAMMGDYLAHTSRMGHLKHGVEVSRTLFQAEREAQELHRKPGATKLQVATAQYGTRELRNRQMPADGDSSANMITNGSQALTSWTVASALVRPAHFFMNLAGGHTAGSALIGGRHGIVAANVAVAKAIGQLTGTSLGTARRDAVSAWRGELNAANWDTSKWYRDRLHRADDIENAHADLLIDRFNQANLINQSRSREMRRMAGPQGYFSSLGPNHFLARAMDVFSAGEHAADSALRVAIGKAAFVTEYAKTKNVMGALDYAEQIARDALPDYNQKPRVATPQGSLGRLAPLMTQFKQFGLHMYGLQANLLANGIRDADPMIRREAQKSLFFLQAQHALLWSGVGGAVFGSIPMMFGLGAYDLLTGSNEPHTNKELEIKARNMAKDLLGKNIADILAYGVPMAAGIDVHRSLQYTNLIGLPELRTLDKEGALNFGIQLLGPSADQAAGIIDSVGKIMRGDLRMETATKLLPRIVRDPVEAYQWGTQGLKNVKGDLTIVRPEQFSAYDLTAKAVGFIPSVVSDARNARAAIDIREKVVDHRRGLILDKYIRTPPAERKAVLPEIMRYNQSAPPEERITGQMIQQRVREQARINTQPNLHGMRGVSKPEIRATEEWTRFARP